MLDADEAVLTKTGTITISDGQITISGFDGAGTSCREIAVLALLWGIGQLQKDLQATLERPGGGIAVVD